LKHTWAVSFNVELSSLYQSLVATFILLKELLSLHKWLEMQRINKNKDQIMIVQSE